jgi:methylthioribose-1-phosphate isomerase
MCANMAATRPTAPDLFKCIEQMKREVTEHRGTHPALLERLTLRADELQSSRYTLDNAIAEQGEAFIKPGMKILLHGSSGALATGGFGTALGAVKASKNNGKGGVSLVIAESRPDMAGGRVCAYEALKFGIKTAVCADSAVGHVLQQKVVDCVIVDAMKVAGNGDTACAPGCYPIAALCKLHNIPFYVMATCANIDVSSPSSDAFITEERSGIMLREVGTGRSAVTVVHKAASLINPTFDRTPANMITAIITEEGPATPDQHGNYVESLREKLQASRARRQ